MTSLKLTDRLPINGIACALKPLVSRKGLGFRSLQVVVNPTAQGVGTLEDKLAHKRPHTTAGAFFVPAVLSYGGPCWAGFGLAGCQLARFPTPTRSATQSRRKDGGGSSTQVGAHLMKHAFIPSAALKARAATHRAMALAALSSDSSLASRVKRYNRYVMIARDLEVSHGAR